MSTIRHRAARNLVPAVFAVLTPVFVSGCSTENKTSANGAPSNSAMAVNAAAPKGATIPIEANGPADTVRVFYKHLRENKIRDALFLTNLRGAIEGLTEANLKEFSLDFSRVAQLVPEVIEINGEIVTGDKATVTANLPNEDGDKNEVQAINLRREGDVWVILSVDEATEARIKKEGKNYFYSLRIDVKEEEARQMLERISKAQLAYSLQNSGLFADIPTLIAAGLLPGDAQTNESTGYNYTVDLAADRKKYSAAATPALYGKTGRLSFLLKLDAKGISHVTSKDNAGRSLQK